MIDPNTGMVVHGGVLPSSSSVSNSSGASVVSGGVLAGEYGLARMSGV